MANEEFAFRNWSEGQISLYGTDRFYDYSIHHLLRDGKGNEKTLEELEHQLEIDIDRTGDTPITVNGQLPDAGVWTKDTFLAKVQSILGDGWERWKAVMYKPFCVTVSQTIMAYGLAHFQKRLFAGHYALGGSISETGHQITLALDPTTGGVDFLWTMGTNIVHMDDPERSIVSANKFSTHVRFAPGGDTPYTGSIHFAMNQTSLFYTIVERCDRILIETVRRVQFPLYSVLHKPIAVNTPTHEMKLFFQRLADRVVSLIRLREHFPALRNNRLYDSVKKTIVPYFEEGEHIYDLTPDFGDMYIAYLMLMKETILFMNNPNPTFIRFMKLAQNATSHREGVYHIRETLTQLVIYILLRVGRIPRLRIRPSPYSSFYTANERYRMEKNAERTGRPVYQPTMLSVPRTAETLPEPVAVAARSIGFLGGYKTVKKRKQKNRTIKRHKIHKH